MTFTGWKMLREAVENDNMVSMGCTNAARRPQKDPPWDHERHASHAKTKVGREHVDVQIHLLIEKHNAFERYSVSGTNV